MFRPVLLALVLTVGCVPSAPERPTTVQAAEGPPGHPGSSSAAGWLSEPPGTRSGRGKPQSNPEFVTEPSAAEQAATGAGGPSCVDAPPSKGGTASGGAPLQGTSPERCAGPEAPPLAKGYWHWDGVRYVWVEDPPEPKPAPWRR